MIFAYRDLKIEPPKFLKPKYLYTTMQRLLNCLHMKGYDIVIK